MKPGDFVVCTTILGAVAGKVIEYFPDAQPQKSTFMMRDVDGKIRYCNCTDSVVVSESDPAAIVPLLREVGEVPDEFLYDVVKVDESF